MNTRSAGFSLIELLIVIGIIGILSSVLYLNFSESSAQSRDAERRSDLRNLQNALELYKQDNGRYPEACNGPTGWSSTGGGWSGEIGGAHECTSGSAAYIEDLAPEYIPTLPTDPLDRGGDYGYAYAVNGDGTVYKLMSRNTVESETVDYAHPFKSCDATNNNTGMCDQVDSNSNNKPTHCNENNARFQNSYALWGGYASFSQQFSAADTLIENRTENIRCRW